jgi:hypothetical protein
MYDDDDDDGCDGEKYTTERRDHIRESLNLLGYLLIM